jgi:hypothetical protein
LAQAHALNPEPAIDIVSQFENLLVEGETVAGRFHDAVAGAL